MDAKDASQYAGRLAAGMELTGLKCWLPVRDGARIVGRKPMSPVAMIGQLMRVTGCWFTVEPPPGQVADDPALEAGRALQEAAREPRETPVLPFRRRDGET